MHKKKLILIIICLVGFFLLAGGYITLDWFLFFSGLADHNQPEIFYVRCTKLISSFLCFFLVLLIRKDGIDPGDPKRLTAAFIALFTADILLFFDITYPGIVFFTVTHILFVVRHLHGFKHLKQKIGTAMCIKGGMLKALFLLILYVLVLLFVMLPVSGVNLFFLIIVLYGLIITAALWSALVSLQIGFLPLTNAIIAVAGIACLFLSDIAVGYKLISGPSPLRTMITFSIWVGYGPGILMLALSGYDFRKLFVSKQL